MDPSESPDQTVGALNTATSISAATHTAGQSCRTCRDQWVRDIPRRRRVSVELETLLQRLYPKATRNRPPALPESARRALANRMWTEHGWQLWECAARFAVEPKDSYRVAA